LTLTLIVKLRPYN